MGTPRIFSTSPGVPAQQSLRTTALVLFSAPRNLNKMLANEIYLYREEIIFHDQAELIPREQGWFNILKQSRKQGLEEISAHSCPCSIIPKSQEVQEANSQ